MLPDIVVVSRTLEPIDPAAVAELEGAVGVPLPAGYAELLATYGEGTFCNELDLWGPGRVLDRLARAREDWDQYWFWDEHLVTRSEMGTAVQVGDSANGDQLALVPGKGLVFLPRHEEVAHGVGSSWVDALTWFCTSGTLVAPHGLLWFESWAEPATYENWTAGSLEAARDGVAARGRHVVEDRAADGSASTFLVPAMGGHLYVAELDGGSAGRVYAHLRYLPDLAEAADDLSRALLSAGMRRQSRWGAEPAG